MGHVRTHGWCCHAHTDGDGDKLHGVLYMQCLTGTQLSNGIPHGVQCSRAQWGMGVRLNAARYVPQYCSSAALCNTACENVTGLMRNAMKVLHAACRHTKGTANILIGDGTHR